MHKILLLLLTIGASCLSQTIPIPHIEYSPKKYICYTAGEPITIDGKLTESAWARAEWTDKFTDIEGSIRPVPRFWTRAKMLWDDKYFYVAAEIQDPHIWATLKKRDDIIFLNNDFEIFLDPGGDTQNYVEFEINALNTFWDQVIVMPYRDIDKAALAQWDMKGLKTGVAIHGTLNKAGDTDSSWTVEVAFPWEGFKEITDLACPPTNADQWRVNFSRVEWKSEVKNGKYQRVINPATNRPYPEDNWVWSPQGIVNMHYPELWGYVQFSRETVGHKKSDFVEKSEEAAKWKLRQLYYAEWAYRDAHKTFTNDVKNLDLTLAPTPGYAMTPVIESTTTQFTASLESADGSSMVTIRNDGLTRIVKVKK